MTRDCLAYALSNRITHGIWGGLTERERRPLQTRWVQDARRDRDRAIVAADAAGYTTAAIAHSFGLSRTSVIRIVDSRDDPPPRHSGRRTEHRIVRVVADPGQQRHEHVEPLLREAVHLPERTGLQIRPVAHAWVRRIWM
jgi:hypothetical protein